MTARENKRFTGRPNPLVVSMAIPNTEGSIIPTQPAAMVREVEHLQEQIETARSYERLLKANLAALRARPSIDDVRAKVTALELEKEDLTDRLEGLRSGKVKTVSVEDKERVEMAWIQWKNKVDSRKRIFTEMWAMVQDGLPEGQTKEQLWV